MWRWVVQMVFLVAASVGLAWGGNTLARNWHVNFTQHYSEIFASHIFVDLAKHDPTSTRLCVMNYRYYPFFGSRRQYRLCRPRKAFSYAWLIAYLRDQQVNTVACLQQDERINSRYRGVSLWLREHPEVFVTQEEDASFIWADIDQQQLEKAAQP